MPFVPLVFAGLGVVVTGTVAGGAVGDQRFWVARVGSAPGNLAVVGRGTVLAFHAGLHIGKVLPRALLPSFAKATRAGVLGSSVAARRTGLRVGSTRPVAGRARLKSTARTRVRGRTSVATSRTSL